MRKNEKRKLRTYKTFDDIYNNAMNRADRDDVYLCTFLEKVLVAYGQGKTIIAKGRGSKHDLLSEKNTK